MIAELVYTPFNAEGVSGKDFAHKVTFCTVGAAYQWMEEHARRNQYAMCEVKSLEGRDLRLRVLFQLTYLDMGKRKERMFIGYPGRDFDVSA